MLIVYIYLFFKQDLEEKEEFKNLPILLVYSISTILVIYPISDKAHFIIGSMCRNFNNYILLIYTSKKSYI